MGEVCNHGDWNPPNSSKAVKSEACSWFIWKAGNMTPMPPNHNQNKAVSQYCVNSIFSQGPAAPHLLAVNCNAEQKNAGDNGRWSRLKFNHRRAGNSNTYLSEIDLGGTKNQIAAPAGSAPWKDQLLPSVYDATPTSDSQGTQAPSTKVQGGLIGRLSLLIALAAFSAPANRVGEVLRNHVKPHRWQRGGFHYPCGRSKCYDLAKIYLLNVYEILLTEAWLLLCVSTP